MNELTLNDDELLTLWELLDSKKVLSDTEQDLLDTVNRAVARYNDRQCEYNSHPW
jgi:hypothetical protein